MGDLPTLCQWLLLFPRQPIFFGHEFVLSDSTTKTKPTYANFDRLFHRVSKGYPAPAPAEMFVTGEENYRDLAANYYGDPSMADVIAAGNGYHEGESTRSNMPVRIPNNAFSIDEHNRYDQWAVYNSNGIIGSLQPTFPLPPLPPPPKQHGSSFFGEILEFVVAAVVMAVVPELIGFMLPAITGTGVLALLGDALEDSVEYAIANATASLAQQVVAVAFHMQNQINMGEVLSQGESGAESGALQGLLGGLKPHQIASAMSFPKSLERTIKIAVAHKIIAMVTGQHNPFSWKMLVQKTLLQAVNMGMNKLGKPSNLLTEMAEQALTRTASAVIQHELYGTPINPEEIAASAIGSSIGQCCGGMIDNTIKAKSDNSSKLPTRAFLSHHSTVNQPGFGPTAPTQLQQGAESNPPINLKKGVNGAYGSEIDWNNPTDSSAHSVNRSEGGSFRFFMNTARRTLAKVSQGIEGNSKRQESLILEAGLGVVKAEQQVASLLNSLESDAKNPLTAAKAVVESIDRQNLDITPKKMLTKGSKGFPLAEAAVSIWELRDVKPKNRLKTAFIDVGKILGGIAGAAVVAPAAAAETGVTLGIGIVAVPAIEYAGSVVGSTVGGDMGAHSYTLFESKKGEIENDYDEVKDYFENKF